MAEKKLPPTKYGESDGPSSHGWHKVESAFRCPKEFQFEHVRGISRPMKSLPDYFAIGILMHVAKGHWFASQFDTSEKMMKHCHDKVIEASLKQRLPVTGDAVQKTLKYFAEYVEHYRIRPLPKVMQAEYLIGPARFVKGDNSRWSMRTARLDDVSNYVEAGNRLCIGEAKTTSGSIADVVLRYTMHGQPFLQMALWDMTKSGKGTYGDIAGIMLDVIVKGYGKSNSKFARVLIPKPMPTAMEWYKRDLTSLLESASKVTWDSKVPRNITQCVRTIGRATVTCPFFKLCQYGKDAAGQFVLPEGKPLTDRKQWKGPTPPWE